MIRLQNQMRARGAIDYIQQNYLRDAKQNMDPSQGEPNISSENKE